ncbi:transglycosylase domain-containing protein [Capsulimonas sp.]|uniref:transglycosylase domain-containing protein n=2 Tax=Capsulimonas sp. TaxID=2494211 RepID=UPI00326635B3
MAVFWAAKDWLTSSANPYPYAQSMALTVPGILLYFGVALFSVRHIIKPILVILAVSLVVVACNGGVISILIASIAYTLSWMAGRCERATATVTTISVLASVTVGGCFVYLSGALFVRPSDGFDPWLGNGIGASSTVGMPVALRVACDIGIPCVILIVLLMMVSFAIGVLGALQDRQTPDGDARRLLARASVSTLVGIIISFLNGPTVSVLTINVGACVAVAGVLAAVRPAFTRNIPRKEGITHRRRNVVWVAVVVFIGVIICVDMMARRAVTSYLSSINSVADGCVSLSTVSPAMQDATIAMEDHAFYQHHGFDWIAMHHALRVNLREGQIKEGGSTITQQLAKNLFLTNDRTVWRKIKEAAYTWELERMLPKSRILELYLNTIDYGMGQHGIAAAAGYYFHKTPDKLTLAESAILVGIVPDPMQKQVDTPRLLDGQHTALSRVRYFFPARYSQEDCDLASWYPLNMLLYPDKDAWDRGATGQIPADWHGVKFYFFANSDEPLPIDQASLSLKDRLAGFLDDAHEHLHVVGIDHLGVYNDRSTRQEEKIISSHAYGQAIDISGFRFADGSRVSVKDHNNPKVMARLAPLEAMLKRHFDAVVDWNDEPKYHQTHFHTEVKGPRPTAPRPVQDPPAKNVDETMAEIRGAKSLPPRLVTWLSGTLVRQTTYHSCGEASVATVLSNYLKKPATEPEIMQLLKSTGTSSEQLIQAFKAHGESAVENVVTADELLDRVKTSGIPVIATLSRPAGHWVVVVGDWGDYLLIADPQRGNVLMPKNEFYARSDGEIVSIVRTQR